jgi:HAD superfamily hydrolase (TIGR01509 family)
VHWSPRYYAAYRDAGGALDFAAFDPLFQASDVAMAGRPGVAGLGFRATIELQVRVLAALLPPSDRERVDLNALAERFHTDAVAAVRRNIPILDVLARRYRLGIVSNFTGNLQPCLEELGLARLFASVSDSGVVGWAKPDRRIFGHALTALGASPQRAWMVGDNFEADIRAAAALGMRTCWLAPPDRATPPADGRVPTARIGRLPEIAGVLG